MRVSPTAKQLIRHAMAISGLSAGDLAVQGARRVLNEHERIVLRGQNKQQFFDALLNPSEPADKLIAAFRHHHQLAG